MILYRNNCVIFIYTCIEYWKHANVSGGGGVEGLFCFSGGRASRPIFGNFTIRKLLWFKLIIGYFSGNFISGYIHPIGESQHYLSILVGNFFQKQGNILNKGGFFNPEVHCLMNLCWGDNNMLRFSFCQRGKI